MTACNYPICVLKLDICVEATRAQGDEVAGNENEATEHDVSTQASGDPNSESGALHTVEVRLFLMHSRRILFFKV